VLASIVMLVATLMGMQYVQGINVLDFLGVYLALFLMAFGLSSLFVMLALRSSSWESQMAIMNLLNLPLLFASNSFYPTSSMPSWLRPVSDINPLSYTNEAIRQLLLGIQGNLTIDFTYLSLFAFILALIGIILSWRALTAK